MSKDIEKKYKYKTLVSSFARVAPEVKRGKDVATASLNNLAEVFDDDMQEEIRGNPDLLYISSNLILLDHANLNDDCVLKAEMIELYEKYENKWLDVEHDRMTIVGMVSEAGFSSYPQNQMMESEEAALTTEPVQLVIGGFLWRIINSKLCDKIEEASVESSPIYGAVSTSFELLFDFYDIGVGLAGERDVNKCRIVREGDGDWDKYDKMLRANRGTGTTGEGSEDIVFRILRNVWPAGAGIVGRPASGLRGILALDKFNTATDVEEKNKSEKSDIEKDREDQEVASTVESLDVPIFIKTDKLSVSDTINLQNITMPIVIKNIDDIVSQWGEFVKNEANASEVRTFIANEIAKEGEKFAAKLAEKENLVKTVEANKIEAEKKAKDLEVTVADLTQKLNAIEEAQNATAAEQKFNERMTSMDEVFDLTDEDRAVLAEEIREIDTDEAFALWFDKKKKFNKEKTKAYKDQKKCEMKAELAKAGVEVEVGNDLNFAKILVAAKVLPGQDVTNTVSTTESIKDKFSKAFSDGVTVGGKKVNFNTKSE